MVAGVASLAGEIILRIALAVFEACVYILAASVRPWRYLLSRSFRTKVNAQHAQSHPFSKWWNLFWGIVVLLASISIVAALVVLVNRPSSSGAVDSNEHRHVLQQMERAILRKLTEKRSAD
jgi:hypothetical protein